MKVISELPSPGCPKVLILLAAFNGSRWIVEQIESILNQKNADVTLVISDDCSTDDTRLKIDRYAERDLRVRVVSPPKATGSAAKNFLWLIQTTPLGNHGFVSFADQDDVWDHDKLSRGISMLVKSGAAGYSCAVTAFWNNGREMTLGQSNRLTASDFLFESAGQGCTYLLSGDFYIKARHFILQHTDEILSVRYHDWAIYALSRSWKLGWIFDEMPRLRYRQHSLNDTGARYTLDGVFKRIALLRTGWYGAQLRTIARICIAASPTDPTIGEWCNILYRTQSIKRRYDIVRFCINKGGRRRSAETAIVIGAAIAGWL